MCCGGRGWRGVLGGHGLQQLWGQVASQCVVVVEDLASSDVYEPV